MRLTRRERWLHADAKYAGHQRSGRTVIGTDGLGIRSECGIHAVPFVFCKHRKQLEENSLAPWELRVGDFRVFYDVDVAEETVIVIAVGHVHNTLRIAGEEFEL